MLFCTLFRHGFPEIVTRHKKKINVLRWRIQEPKLKTWRTLVQAAPEKYENWSEYLFCGPDFGDFDRSFRYVSWLELMSKRPSSGYSVFLKYEALLLTPLLVCCKVGGQKSP